MSSGMSMMKIENYVRVVLWTLVQVRTKTESTKTLVQNDLDYTDIQRYKRL